MDLAKLRMMMREVDTFMVDHPGLKVAVACNDRHDAKLMYDHLAAQPRSCTYTVTYFDERKALQVYAP
jgi:hypothetical protein